MDWYFSPWFLGVHWASAFGSVCSALQMSTRGGSACNIRKAVQAGIYAALGYLALGLIIGFLNFRPPFAEYAVRWPW